MRRKEIKSFGRAIAQDLLLARFAPVRVSEPVICRPAGGAPGDRSERPLPGHLQHEEEGDGELTEGTFTTAPPKG